MNWKTTVTLYYFFLIPNWKTTVTKYSIWKHELEKTVTLFYFINPELENYRYKVFYLET